MIDYTNLQQIKKIDNLMHLIEPEWTHFHVICHYNPSLEIIKYCIDKKSDLNFKNVNNSTPFHWICWNKFVDKEVLEYCLKNGANILINNNWNITPFYLICYNNENLIKYCKQYINEYDFIKTLKQVGLNWKLY